MCRSPPCLVNFVPEDLAVQSGLCDSLLQLDAMQRRDDSNFHEASSKRPAGHAGRTHSYASGLTIMQQTTASQSDVMFVWMR